MQFKIRTSRDMQGTSWRVLSLAISGALLAPGVAMAAEGAIVADGEHKHPPVDTYFTTAYAGHVLQALNAGSITTLSGTTIRSSGDSAFGAYAYGAGSGIALAGTSVTTSGNASVALYVHDGASMTVTAGADGRRSNVSTTGNGAAGVLAEGVGTKVTFEDGDITTTGQISYGVKLDDGASGDVTRSTIRTTGLDAHGIQLSSATATVAGSRIETEGDRSHAVMLMGGSAATLVNTEIGTSGLNAYGINLNKRDTRLDLDSVTIRTSGEASYGIFAPNVSEIVARDLFIETTGSGAAGIVAQGATVQADGGKVVTSGQGASAVMLGRSSTGESSIADLSRMTIRSEGDRSYGVLTSNGAKATLRGSLVETRGNQSHGIGIGAGSVASLDATHVQTSGQDAHGLRLTHGGQASLSDSQVLTEGEGSWAASFENGGQLVARKARFSSSSHGAFIAHGDVRLELDEGSQASGGNGVLLSIDDVARTQALALRGQSVAHGDIVLSDDVISAGGRTDGSRGVTVDLDGGSVWRGKTHDAVGNVSIADGAQWAMTGNSRIGELQLDGGSIWFESPTDGTYKTLQVAGDYTGTGGMVRMNSALAAGGALSNQLTDRLLVGGDVRTTGTTYLTVDSMGNGGLTDINRNGKIDADEGYSLIQVKGASRADAFALAGGYVAAGPWQYTLQSFGPGEVDASQNGFADGTAQWDYRLGNRYVDDTTGPRPTIVPQLPAYLSAPNALFAYGNQLNSGLHTRLGEISQASPNYEPHNAEMFVRYVGGQLRYHSDLKASQYGYGFDQQINALQLGGNIVTWVAKGATFRAGWAADHGSTDVTPKADDGRSKVRFDAYGFLAWLTWYQDNGFYLDGVVGNRRYAGRVHTEARGTDMARMHANGWTASLESGHPFQINRQWTIEPQAQLTYQQLRFRDIKDVDGLTTRIGTTRQLQTRIGARALWESGNGLQR